jgi:serine/threonine-protein kinase RsbW
MKRHPKEYSLVIPSKLGKLIEAEAFTETVAAAASLSKDQSNNLAIAITEATGNAIVHGNQKNPQKKVRIRFRISKTQVTAEVSDEGSGFNPDTVSNPLKPENIMKENGRGIFILKSLMDKVSFHFTPKGTTIRMTLKIRKSDR